ncbi:hypothetical protein ScPMuIL_007161 [Solemya velum]
MFGLSPYGLIYCFILIGLYRFPASDSSFRSSWFENLHARNTMQLPKLVLMTEIDTSAANSRVDIQSRPISINENLRVCAENPHNSDKASMEKSVVRWSDQDTSAIISCFEAYFKEGISNKDELPRSPMKSEFISTKRLCFQDNPRPQRFRNQPGLHDVSVIKLSGLVVFAFQSKLASSSEGP